ncbi:hypothetical protein IGJ71_002608 [Enterococcus sp. DIV2324]
MKKINRYKIKILGSLLLAVIMMLVNFDRYSLYSAVLISYSLFQAMDLYHDSKIY